MEIGPVTAAMACLNGNGTIRISPVWVSRDDNTIPLNSVPVAKPSVGDG